MWIPFDEVDNEWRSSQVINPRGRQINESCDNFRGQATVIHNLWIELECRHRQSHSLSVNWARSSSENISKNYPMLCLSSVRPTWDMPMLHNKNAVSIQKPLGTNGTSVRQRNVSRPLKTVLWLLLWAEWNKDDVRKFIYFENGCTNLRLYIFTDVSIETISIVAYLQDEAMFNFIYVKGNCRLTPNRHITIPELGSESRYPANMMSDLKKSIIGTTHQQCYKGYKQRTRNKNCSLRAEQRKYWKTHLCINGDTSKLSKTLLTSEPEECPSIASSSPCS